MKNVSTLKPGARIESPKTPGGISKSLLTPCRRIGLSRNWRKGSVSPFVSPLAGSGEGKVDNSESTPKRESRKRKDRTGEKCTVETSQALTKEEDNEENTTENVSTGKNYDIETTPLRTIVSPRKKKSKTLLLASKIVNDDELGDELEDVTTEKKLDEPVVENVTVPRTESEIATPVPTNSSSKTSKVLIARNDNTAKLLKSQDNSNICVESIDLKENPECLNDGVKYEMKQRSPDNLTKGCVVVIQKKLYKKDLEILKQKQTKRDKELKKKTNSISQTLFDSDSDDAPLSILNKNKVATKDEPPKQHKFDDDDDFTETKKIKVKKMEDKTTSIGGLPSDINNKKKSKQKKDLLSKSKSKPVEQVPFISNLMPSTQSSLDDDDFVMDKRTILIKKTYSKVMKPHKAKSTGSITQKDIDDLKARIEIKKKLLLAKAVTPDTEELRDLIKKWQKGCQDALIELMELMKTKLPDKQNMDYAEILQTLKIPPALVGYDEDSDCFNTPTDENIVLAKFNNI